MAIKIPVPEYPNTTLNITLNGEEYDFFYTFNSRDDRWRLSIYRDEEAIIEGVKLIEGQFLLQQYLLDDFSHGDMFCFKSNDTDELIGRYNIGVDKDYELLYLTNEEIG